MVRQKLNIATRIWGQGIEFSYTHRGSFPSRQSRIHRFHTTQILRDRRQRFTNLAVQFVAGADLDLIQRIEDVELRQRNRSEAIDLCCITSGECIEPTATTWSTSRSAILATSLADQLAQFRFAFEHLCWKGTLTHASCVSAHNPKHAGKAVRSQAGADDCTARNGA